MTSTARKRFRLAPGMIAALLIAFFTFVAADVVNKNVFERLPHLEDEFGYLFQAKIFAHGQAYVVRQDNDPVKYFWQPFVLQPDTPVNGIYERFGKYTPGWPLVLSIGVLLGQWWVINAFLAMLSVALVYRLGREIFDEAVGLCSALLLAISPMALLLNGTLMSHVSAMFFTIVFVYSYWRMIKNGKGRYRWAILAGLAIGMVAATRPLTAVAMAAPVGLHALSRLLDSLSGPEKQESRLNLGAKLSLGMNILLGRQAMAKNAAENAEKPRGTFSLKRVGAVLMPLIVMGIFALPTLGLWPLFNQIWTGDWKTNTYLLLWPYDQVGFGPDHGLMKPTGCESEWGCHTLEYGFTNARADLNVYLRDLFGFTLDPGLAQYAADNLGWGAGVGLSWILVVAGLIAGYKKEWIWLFFEFFVAIVIAQLAYWIGSVVRGGAAYSLRYYYEATFGVCLVAGYGAVAIARSLRSKEDKRLLEKRDLLKASNTIPGSSLALAVPIDYLNGSGSGRADQPLTRPISFFGRLRLAWAELSPGYFLFLFACAVSLIWYTPARFKEALPGWPDGLFRYNKVGQDQLDALNTVRKDSGQPNKPVLIIVLRDPSPNAEGDDWRNYGAAMALEDPFLTGDIVVVRSFDKENVPDLIQRFKDRLVLYQVNNKLYTSLEDAGY